MVAAKVQHELQATHPKDQQGESDEIDGLGLPIGFDGLQQHDTHANTKDRNGHVDQEYQPP